MSRASELADQLRSAVQTYPQMSEDEPGGYCRQEDQLMDDAAAELERLERVNAELVEAMQEWKEFFDADVEPGESTIDKMLAALTSATKEQQK